MVCCLVLDLSSFLPVVILFYTYEFSRWIGTSDSSEVANGYPLVTAVFKHKLMAGKSLDLGLLDWMQEVCFWHLYFGISLLPEATFLIFSGLMSLQRSRWLFKTFDFLFTMRNLALSPSCVTQSKS